MQNNFLNAGDWPAWAPAADEGVRPTTHALGSDFTYWAGGAAGGGTMSGSVLPRWQV